MIRRGTVGMTAAMAAAALMFTGCSGSGGAQEPGEEGALSFYTGEPKSLNPLKDISSQIGMALCANLVELNKETQKFENLVAEDVTSDDAKNWTITLKEGWTFQDGTPVTASSYVDAWNAAAYGPNAWQANGTFTIIKGYSDLNPSDGAEPKSKELAGVEAVDDRTITVELNEPNSDFPKVLSTNATCPLPEVAFEDFDAYEDNPISNGPYKFVERVENQHVKMEKWDGFKGDAAFTGQATTLLAKEYTSPDSAYTDLTAGNLDMIRNVPATMISRADQELPEGSLYEVSIGSKQSRLTVPDYLPEYEDPKLRKAISLSIDRQTLADTILEGYAEPSDSLVPPAVGSYREGSCEDCTFDPEKAKKLFDESGGIDEITIQYTENSQPLVQAMGKQITDTLGVPVKYDVELPAAMTEKTNSQELSGLAYGLWGWSYKSPDQYMSVFETNGDGNVALGYSNEKVDELISHARGLQDEEKRNDAYAEAEQRALKDMPLIPLFIPDDYGLQSGCSVLNDVQGDIQFYRADVDCANE